MTNLLLGIWIGFGAAALPFLFILFCVIIHRINPYKEELEETVKVLEDTTKEAYNEREKNRQLFARMSDVQIHLSQMRRANEIPLFHYNALMEILTVRNPTLAVNTPTRQTHETV